MEAEIKRIIEADLKAQARLKETQDRIDEAIKNLAKEKRLVQAEVWNKAKQTLESEKKRLEAEFESNRKDSQAVYNKALTELETRFNEKRDVWLKQLVQRCLSEGIDR